MTKEAIVMRVIPLRECKWENRKMESNGYLLKQSGSAFFQGNGQTLYDQRPLFWTGIKFQAIVIGYIRRFYSERSASLRIKPENIKLWIGYSRYQYSKPKRPLGAKNAVCVRQDFPFCCGATSNCSHAFPGTFISARSSSERFSCTSSTLQKSSASPTRTSSGCLRPRLKPTPPAMRSITPLMRQAQFI